MPGCGSEDRQRETLCSAVASWIALDNFQLHSRSKNGNRYVPLCAHLDTGHTFKCVTDFCL